MNGTHTGRERRMEHGRLNHRMEATSLAWHTGQVRRVGGGSGTQGPSEWVQAVQAPW